ncbi:isopenicillin N synthase family dioxygenase [Pseudomonas vancouverensis]|uniref:2-oxoglutarate-dependent ethylene/succinate-forming enzyme n=1 Tax=Pseudomonas vancouverensis TaxID=95300 RepID=A0A1H2N5G6_PSEVA|nr:2-oxoglutarate and iron-dependent oxygenase domain-containing protein [Pseudomonas vancouverensis]KAB0495873.1 isopenicillin N synthase family oxygenase [Pseudomonas vancouverensis]TDB65675.1 isopenicillin N synthase family oxygenase [Pseudomonas vancouverensis]SDV00401.1 Isopenicillin N synthase [Pseudomonas vancouverensis]
MAPIPRSTPHTAFERLPLVDISGLFSDCAARRIQTAAALGQAAAQAGFLYVTGHGIDAQIIERLKQRTAEYFAQPLERKMHDYIGLSNNHSGYVPEGEEQFAEGSIDHKEAFDVGFDYLQTQGRQPMLGANRWPGLPGFKEDIKAYYDAVFSLSLTLFRGFALALGLPENAISQWVNHPPSQLRLIHYPFAKDAAVDRPGIGAHTDYECFTILLPTAPGLEVLNGAGQWIDVPLVDGAFVINIGDMLEVLSNGAYVATSHRVRKVAEERYAFPMFCACDYETVIEPIAQLVNPATPSRYGPVVCGEHLYAQTLQTFHYLKQRVARGELSLPAGAKALSSFGLVAKGEEACHAPS